MEKMMAVGISAMWPNFHSIVWGLRSELNMSSSPPMDASEWYLEETSTEKHYSSGGTKENRMGERDGAAKRV
jgi:hypothetical protein